MPLLGHGGMLRRDFGEGMIPVPNAIFVDLATWAKIPFLYTPETRRAVAAMVRLAVEPDRLGRLSTVLTDELGHEIAFSVERAKIAANAGDGGTRIGLLNVEQGLTAAISPASMAGALAPFRADLRAAMQATLDLAGTDSGDVVTVILVGGSSLMALVAEEAAALCPGAALRRSEAFTAVVDGLALATAEGVRGAP
jgi:hypothetical chaperone protein